MQHYNDGLPEFSPNSSNSNVQINEDGGGGGGGRMPRNPHPKQQLQQQQTSQQQVTTVLQVVRELKQIDGQPVDYVTMPFEVQPVESDDQPVDYVAMPLGTYPRSQYTSYNNHGQHMPQQQQLYEHGGGSGGGGVGNAGSGGVLTTGVVETNSRISNISSGVVLSGGEDIDNQQFHHPQHYGGYDHYQSSGQYINSQQYVIGGNPGGYLNEYSVSGDRSGTSPNQSDDQSGSQSPSQLNGGGVAAALHHQHQQQHQQQQQQQQQPLSVVASTVAYIQTEYEDMPDYRITPSPGLQGVMNNGVGGIGNGGGLGSVGGGGGGGGGGGSIVGNVAYQDDPSTLVYGYVSTAPYGASNQTSGGQLNSAYGGGGPRSTNLYEENFNNIGGGGGGGGVGSIATNNGTDLVSVSSQSGVGGGQLIFNKEDELHKHMTNLSVQAGVLGLTASPGSINRILNSGGGGGGGGGGVGQMSSVEDDHRNSMRWRDPNLTEVISFLNSPDSVIKANAAAYLQHLCYMDDPNKQRTRTLGGIPPLVKLLSHNSPDVYRNSCGALRNLSYGRQNDENKRSIQGAGGIIALIGLLRRTMESDIKELVTGVIWNMSSCEDLKRAIIDDSISIIVTYIIIPHSGFDEQNPGETCWSNVFRNASGVLRNVSSAGEYARTKLRDCDGLVDSLIYVVRTAIEKSNIGNKIVENCVCILRNLSYRCQEVEDPNYDKHPLPVQGGRLVTDPSPSSGKGDNLGCFGASKKKKDQNNFEPQKDNLTSIGVNNGGNLPQNSGNGTGNIPRATSLQRQDKSKGYEQLWQPEVVQSYLALLQSCSNPETLEAAAGALQNLAACYWQPSIEIRAAVRKEKGLPILVELLRMEVDRVVCAVATALRNLAIDQRNKELIGKYAMRDLVQKLPSGNIQHDQGTSDDTIAAVLATLNEVIKKNAEFSRSLLDAGGVDRLMNITRQRQKYTPRVLKFAGQVLFTMWQHQELRDVYKKHGWKEQDFVTKTVAARNAAPNSPNNANSTLSRPMASQGGTRYEDRTIKRSVGMSSGGSVVATVSTSSIIERGGNGGASGGGACGGGGITASVSGAGLDEENVISKMMSSGDPGLIYQRNNEMAISDYGEKHHHHLQQQQQKQELHNQQQEQQMLLQQQQQQQQLRQHQMQQHPQQQSGRIYADNGPSQPTTTTTTTTTTNQ